MTSTYPAEPVERTFREKVATVSLITSLVLYVPYFLIVGRWLLGGGLGWPTVAMIAALVVVVVLHALLMPLGLLAYWVLGQRAPEQPADERDRAIDARATRAAYLTLVVAGFTLLFVVLSIRPALVANAAVVLQLGFLSFVLAEIVRFAMQVAGYRRGF